MLFIRRDIEHKLIMSEPFKFELTFLASVEEKGSLGRARFTTEQGYRVVAQLGMKMGGGVWGSKK
jgi:hypothetical protein